MKKIARISVCFLLFFLCSTTSIFAQNINLTGKLVDTFSLEPLSFASVSVLYFSALGFVQMLERV